MSREQTPTLPGNVAAAFAVFPEPVRAQLLHVRRLIFEVAAATTDVGPLRETLKWGEPAYLTEVSGSGSTIRLGRVRSAPDRGAVLFNCRTTLVDSFRTLFAHELAFDGNRAIVLDPAAPVPEAPLTACLVQALTYHRGKHRGRSRPTASAAAPSC